MNTFQLVVVGLFVFLAIFAVLAFAGVIPLPGGGGASPTQVLWWGTVPQSQLGPVLADFQRAHEDELLLTYVEKDSRTLEADLINALASGAGPDLIYAPQELIFKQSDKFRPFSYLQIDERRFFDTFIQEAALWLYPDGIIALPLVVDPLVLYYNRDLISTARLASPARTWSELEEQNKVLTVADDRANITQSAIALGVFSNITNAKDILSLLMIQAGNPIVSRTETGWRSRLIDDTLGNSTKPAALALNFFNNFSNSSNSFYAWNSSLPEARQMFARNTLAMYLGYASELEAIRRQNPQINIDVAAVPQPSSAGRPELTLGRLSGLAVLKASPRGTAAAQAALLLAWSDFAQDWSALTKLPPARLDLLRRRPAEAITASFYDSALISRGWYDFDTKASGEILRRLADDVRQGRVEIGQALTTANTQMQALLP